MNDLDKDGKIKPVTEETWDHYSGLPNPKWYENE